MGARFGDFTIRACIGEGGMARVYAAEHAGLKRSLALKVLVDAQGSEQTAHQRFLREACLAAAIKHPNVVNLFDVGVHQGTPYLVMELLEGLDLDAFLRTKGRLDEATIVDLLLPIVSGLAAVHDAGIVHRDLKPSNIFLARGRDDEVTPRLLDFGISKSLGTDALRLTAASGLLLGTPFYMAPEGVNGDEMTPLSDQYSLGVVLYECATGVNPFAEASNFSDVVRRVGLGELPAAASRNPELSPRLVAVIERAMQLDPARRFPDLRALGRELVSLAGERTRLTWNLSFTVLAARAAQSQASAPSPASSAPAAPHPKTSRAGRWLPWAAVAALSLGWARSVERVEGSPMPKADEVSAPTATQSAEPPSPAGDLDSAAIPTQQVLMLAPKPLAPPSTPPAPQEPPAEHPAPSARPVLPAPAARHPVPPTTQPQSTTEFGTNHAPIFE